MRLENGGELVPVGGGDPIPLIQNKMTIGRRESCDICLRFQNVSGMHCELSYQDGYWEIRDLGSTNGIRVNEETVRHKPLRPGDVVSIASHNYTIEYVPTGTHSLNELMEDDIMDQPLLEKAGLLKPKQEDRRRRPKDKTAEAPEMDAENEEQELI